MQRPAAAFLNENAPDCTSGLTVQVWDLLPLQSFRTNSVPLAVAPPARSTHLLVEVRDDLPATARGEDAELLGPSIARGVLLHGRPVGRRAVQDVEGQRHAGVGGMDVVGVAGVE